MALESVTHVGDLVATNPTATDPKQQGDDHLRNLKTALKNSFAGFTGAIVVTGADGGAVNAYTLTPTTALTAYGSRMIALFSPSVTNTGAVTLNISGLGAKSVKSVAGADLVSGDLVSGAVYAALYNGTEFRMLSVTKNYVDQVAMNAALPAQSRGFVGSDGTVAAFTKTHTGYAQNEVKGADIASAATIDLTAPTGNFVHVTGTTTITAITIPVGAERTVIFDGALTLTHGAALLLPGGVNITTAANDRMTVRGDTAGAIVIDYVRADGKGLIGDIPSMVVITSTQTWTPGPNVRKVRVTITDGGGAGNNAAPSPGASGGATGISVLTVTPGVAYTATIGAGGIVPSGAGGSSSFAGSDITTVTTANAALRIKGGAGGLVSGTSHGQGGDSYFTGVGTSTSGGYGAGGDGNQAGQPGVIVIEY